jgi:hypothetical protein
MSAIRRRARAFLGLPALDDPAAMEQPRVVPWLAAPAAFALALAALVVLGVVVEEFLPGRDNWQVNAPAIAGLTAILLLAPSSSTQPRARNAYVAAVVGLAIVGAGFGVAVAGHSSGTAYDATAFVVVTVAALAGCVQFTALTRVERWSMSTRAGSSTSATMGADRTPATARGAARRAAGASGAGATGTSGAGATGAPAAGGDDEPPAPG